HGGHVTDAHSVPGNKFLGEIIDPKGECEQYQADHEERPIMDAPARYFAHFLCNDPGHGVDGLKEGTKALAEIGNSNAITSAKQHHHSLANDTTKPEQHGGENSRKGTGN